MFYGLNNWNAVIDLLKMGESLAACNIKMEELKNGLLNKPVVQIYVLSQHFSIYCYISKKGRYTSPYDNQGKCITGVEASE